jgi:hypothetical protein
MKKNFIKFSMGLCLVAMLGGSSVNLNTAGGGGGQVIYNMKLFTVECTSGPGYWSYCDYCIGHSCDISAQHECMD